MTEIYIARPNPRMGLNLKVKNENLMFFLPTMSQLQLDQLVRKELEKLGITEEREVQKVIENAEKEYFRRLKTEEVSREMRRLMSERVEHSSLRLMQRGNLKWKLTSFRPKGG